MATKEGCGCGGGGTGGGAATKIGSLSWTLQAFECTEHGKTFTEYRTPGTGHAVMRAYPMEAQQRRVKQINKKSYIATFQAVLVKPVGSQEIGWLHWQWVSTEPATAAQIETMREPGLVSVSMLSVECKMTGSKCVLPNGMSGDQYECCEDGNCWFECHDLSNP
jgi:hypothetical protein